MGGNTDLPVINDGPLDEIPNEPVLERLDRIAKKVDDLNKCSISTVQMAKKVYAGLEDVKQITGNFRAEIGKFHTTAAGVTHDLKEVDHAIVSMHERIEIACSSLETKTEQILNDLAREQQKVLDATAKQFLATLETPDAGNPICRINATVSGVQGLALIGVVLGIFNLVLLVFLIFR